MDLVCRTLILSLAFALALAGPLQDSVVVAGKPIKCSEVKLGAVTADDAGTLYFFPDIKERHCEHQLQRHQVMMAKNPGWVGAFAPRCDENGQYHKEQCHGSTGYCWCTDRLGRKKPGTETPPGVPSVNCSRADEPQRLCERHREKVKDVDASLGVFVPKCDEHGDYLPMQCHGSTGECWCVNKRGVQQSTDTVPAGSPPPDCSGADEPKQPRTKCEEQKGKKKPGAGQGPVAGAFKPQCGAKGEFLPKQCHGSTGHCWCVDSTGEEIPGTKTAPGTPSVDCNKSIQRHCDNHKARVEAKGKLLGAFIPKCDENGHYLSKQCHGSTGHCWCVDKKGREISGTRNAPGTDAVDCATAAQERHCERQKSLAQGPKLIGGFEPTCDEHGKFAPEQCHGSTGHCWCVDKMGAERLGTRTPPGSPRTDCQKASRSYLRLDVHHDGLQTFPAAAAWQKVADRVDAAFSCDDRMYLIKEDQIYIYQVKPNNFTLIDGRPKYVAHELGISGRVDAAFVCPDEDIVNVIQGNTLKRVDHAAKVVIEELPMPLSDVDAAVCGPDGIKLFKGSEYYKYESLMVMTASRMAPAPLKITSAMMECED